MPNYLSSKMSFHKISTPSSHGSQEPLSFSEQFKLLDDRTVCINSKGDLDLVVSCGEQSRTFRIFSQVLRSASPVWCVMLDPDSKFATIKKGTFYLEDDDLEALFIILLACHHRYQDIPQSIEPDILLAICVIADKYDCIGVLWPWACDWVDRAYSSAVSYGPEWSIISWAVGDMNKFKKEVARLSLNCATNDLGQCLYKSGEVLNEFLPPDLPSMYTSNDFSALSPISETILISKV